MERRDKERHIELVDYPVLNYSQKRRLVDDLAYWMVKNNLSEVASDLVDERFDRKLRNMPGVSPDTSGSRVRQFFAERTGIIREPAAGRTDFAHRTFQEFLAAQAALDDMDIGMLVEHAHNDQWREVIILAAGLAPQSTCEQLIAGLIVRGDREKDFRYQLHLLAVSCFETSVELRQDIRTEVDKRLNALIPPTNVVDAEALAAAGELAVKYLARKNEYTVTVAAACIRTLSVIGSDSAERETFAIRVLSHALRHRSCLSMETLSSLEGFQYFTSLTELQLSDCSEVSDLSPLKGLTQLTVLNLSRCSYVKVFSLPSLTQLEKLDLSGCTQLSTITLGNLTALRKLDLTNCCRVSELSSMVGLTQLKELFLLGCSQVADLSELAKLKSLRGIVLTDGMLKKLIIPQSIEDKIVVQQELWA